MADGVEDGVQTEGTDDWRMRAACRPYDSELFFPDRAAYRNNEVARAKAVCRQCPVRELCLQAAMDSREKVGIWGGMTPEERSRLHRRNRRARTDVEAVEKNRTTGPSRSPITDAGYPTREQIRRGVAAGWLRLDAHPYAGREASRA